MKAFILLKVSPHKHQVMFFSAKSSFYFYSEGCAYLSSFIMTCKLADDSVVSGKVLHEDGGDFSKVSCTPGSYRRDFTAQISGKNVNQSDQNLSLTWQTTLMSSFFFFLRQQVLYVTLTVSPHLFKCNIKYNI